MFTLLPPIGEIDVYGSKRNIKSCMNEAQNAEMCEGDVLFVAQPQKSRPTCSDNDSQVFTDLRPGTTNGGLHSQRGFTEGGEISEENMLESVKITMQKDGDQLTNWVSYSQDDETTTQEMLSGVLTKSRIGSREGEREREHAAERPSDYEPGQPQKLSFEDELTFIPKLNALSLKIAQSRTSIAKRIKVSCESRAAALDKEMAQNFTFRPSISENSLKIADRLKTDFWTRQKLHTERQKKMLESSPSTWQPKSKMNATKQSVTLNESTHKQKPTSDQAAQGKDVRADWAFYVKKETMEKNSPYTKSYDNILIKERKTHFRDLPLHKLESLKPKPIKKLEHRKAEKVHSDGDDEAATCESNSEPSSPQKIRLPNVSKSIDNGILEYADQTNRGIKTSKGVHKRCKTMPPNQLHKIHRPLIVDPDRFLKTKNAAEQALKNKKVFMCMGPYPVLRACLRRRGWIEKHFKADIACSKAAQKRSPDNASRDSDDDDDEVQDTDSPIGERDKQKGSSPRIRDSSNDKSDSTKQQRWGFGRNEGTNFTTRSNSDKNNTETKSRYAYGTTTVGNFEDLDEGFESDSQYGIMSRIARNAVPALIWTCRRSDIEFNYLTKDQIVNHFVHASSFTTKFGLCINIRNLPWFDNASPDSFFPRCHRLSSDSEQQDFIDDYRMLSAIAIISHTLKMFKDKGKAYNTTSHDKILTPRALLLAMKACQGYLRSREHLDIEGEMQTSDEQLFGLSDETWNQLIEFFYQITRHKGIVIGADSYIDECQEILDKMQETYPQVSLNNRNVWIVKPGAKSRGRGIMVMDNLQEILKLSSSCSVSKKENKWVVQKYIERPLLIYNTKFDIRQWFLVTDWNPLTLWFYKDCYLRFCSQEFTMNKFDPKYHLANNSIQKDYSNGPRSKYLPDDNMWTKDQYIDYLRDHGQGEFWDEVIYPNMKCSIINTLQSCQDSLEYRKNSFELFGADFMLSEDMKLWLIEINCSPAMGPSTAITEKLCAEVIEDTLKVVLDRKENKSCDTGKFELAFKQQYIPIPVYTGNTLTVEGEGCKKPAQQSLSPQHAELKIVRITKFKEDKEKSKDTTKGATEVSEKIVPIKCASPTLKTKFKHEQPDISGFKKEKTACADTLKKDLKNLILNSKNANWHGCLCGKGEQCKVVSGYHVKNASLNVTIPGIKDLTRESSTASSQDGAVPNRLTKQTLKLARMHRKAKKKMAKATLRYQQNSEGSGLSIGPGNGVTQM